MRVRYSGDWPDDARPAAADALESAKRIFPCWLRDLALEYDREQSACPANVETLVHYAAATVTIGPPFLEMAALLRRETMAHEAFHVALAPLVALAYDIAAEVAESNDRLGAYMKEQVRQAYERVTSDLEEAFTNTRGTS